MKLIAIGDNVADCYLDQKKYYPGGNCVNVAVSAKKNGAEHVSYIGIFGSDDIAKHIEYALDQEGVDHLHCRYAKGISGLPQVSLTEEGERIFVGGPKNTVQHLFKIQLTIEELKFIEDFDLCHVSVYSSMESELEKLADLIEISYDFSNQLDLNYIRKVAPYISYAFFSASELSSVELEEFMDSLSEFNFKVVGVTRGGHPAMFIHNSKTYYQILRPISVIDTMGAGDSLIGGFLVSYLSNHTIEEAISIGTLSAEKTCQIDGGFGYPHSL
ncbi:PfkB family carbohydrate kinase [Psychrobacillus sp. BM2]|uniref:PfkB family carbohydrate kinase n=1 Tax=Psychrobacillus sp. BM2 TaxID=3400421 RepID=UPI003B01E7C2